MSNSTLWSVYFKDLTSWRTVSRREGLGSNIRFLFVAEQEQSSGSTKQQQSEIATATSLKPGGLVFRMDLARVILTGVQRVNSDR